MDDVIIEGDNVFGGGVNIAARLEALCEPGCILVSRTVQEKVLKRIKLTIDSLGNSELKNIEGKFEIFHIDPSGGSKVKVLDTKKEDPDSEIKIAKPRIIVLPFRNLNNVILITKSMSLLIIYTITNTFLKSTITKWITKY